MQNETADNRPQCGKTGHGKTGKTRARQGFLSAERWLHRLASSRHGMMLLGAIAALETVFLPIAFELILLPYMVANRSSVWRIAAIALLGALIGALIGYAMVYGLFELFGRALIEQIGLADSYADYRDDFRRNGFLAILLVALGPIPYQLAVLATVAMEYPLGFLLLATAIGRGIRFFALAVAVWAFAEQTIGLWSRNAALAGLIAAGLLVALLAAIPALGLGLPDDGRMR